jgi:hypothetical protein
MKYGFHWWTIGYTYIQSNEFFSIEKIEQTRKYSISTYFIDFVSKVLLSDLGQLYKNKTICKLYVIKCT